MVERPRIIRDVKGGRYWRDPAGQPASAYSMESTGTFSEAPGASVTLTRWPVQDDICCSFERRSFRVVLLSTWSIICCTARHSERTEQSTEFVHKDSLPECSSQNAGS